MPTARYEDLLLETCPQVIETDAQYEAAMSPLRELVRKGRARTPDETKLMRLLSLLIQDYDRRHEVLSNENSTSAERLRFVLQESGKTTADLLPIFGQRSHVNEALNGKRPISATQAKRLGAMFRLKPGYFL